MAIIDVGYKTLDKIETLPEEEYRITRDYLMDDVHLIENNNPIVDDE